MRARRRERNYREKRGTTYVAKTVITIFAMPPYILPLVGLNIKYPSVITTRQWPRLASNVHAGCHPWYARTEFSLVNSRALRTFEAGESDNTWAHARMNRRI